MSERKNIDRLFQEKFKDFERLPSDKVWENIQLELNSEKKRKSGIVPFWSRLCGTAAIFLIGFSVATTFFIEPTTNNPQLPSVVTAGEKTDAIKTTTATEGNNSNWIKEDDRIVTTGTNSVPVKKANILSTSAAQNTTTPAGISFANDRNNNLSTAVTSQVPNPEVSSANPKSEKETTQRLQDWESGNALTDDNAWAQNTNNTGEDKIVLDTTNPNHENLEDLLYEDNSSKVAFEAGKGRYVKKESQKMTVVATPQSENQKTADKNNPVVIHKNHSLAKILTDKKAIVAQDSLHKAKGTTEQNPLDAILKEKEETELENKKGRNETRWAVNPKVAPIFMNASGSASSLDAQFDDNNKNYQTSFSYGMGINYAVTKKLTVRTGIHKMTLQYDTNGVLFYESKDSRNLQNVRRNATGSAIQIEDYDSRALAYSENNLVTEKTNGALNQKMGYIEVPLEISYKILDRKFSLEVIGGMSTLFLDENEISLVSANQEMVIGEAKNLNDIHLSSNIGLGFNYKFSKAFEANMEPMFKYQINTYSSNAGDFKPYFFGLYTGIRYRF